MWKKCDKNCTIGRFIFRLRYFYNDGSRIGPAESESSAGNLRCSDKIVANPVLKQSVLPAVCSIISVYAGVL